MSTSNAIALRIAARGERAGTKREAASRRPINDDGSQRVPLDRRRVLDTLIDAACARDRR
jgi:hypothetical protein